MNDTAASDFSKGASLAELSKKYDAKLTNVRMALRLHFGKIKYLKIARTNGGRAVARKLKDAQYRSKYVAKMRLRVKNKLASLMLNKTFRKSWLKKARTGSKKGTETLANLMKNSSFRRSWSEKCRHGGENAYKNNSGIHASCPKVRRVWSIRGLKKTGRKSVGPNGEKMYNPFEASVARLFKKQGIIYTYEQIIKAPNKNGFISIDFKLPRSVFVEATHWDDAKEKAAQLNAKWALLKRIRPEAKLIVITTPQYEAAYRRLLERDIKLHTLNSLRTLLASGVFF